MLTTQTVLFAFESVLLIFSLMFTSISGYINGTNRDAAQLQKKTGGYIYGVCHPDENYELIDDIGLGRVRFDK